MGPSQHSDVLEAARDDLNARSTVVARRVCAFKSSPTVEVPERPLREFVSVLH